jgi:hypothetical protein
MKNIIYRLLLIMPLVLLMSLSDCSESNSFNKLSRIEVNDGWMLLFDGETTDGWRGYNREFFPSHGWVVEDGSLTCITGRPEIDRAGTIIYDRKFLNFHLKLDWKISERGNSGIFYLAQEIPRTGIAQTGLEYQLLDNDRHPDALQGIDGNRKAASLYDILPAVPQNTNPPGEWNSAEIIVYNGHVTHRQNGEDVVKVQLGTPQWDEMVEKSKFNGEIFGKFVEGYIGLQDHGDDIWFRNIKIKPL